MPKRRANNLDGRTWTRYSISVWSDIARSLEEKRLRHPALFPEALPARLIECFTASEEAVVLDPFAGAGSTLLAAARLGRRSVGIEICQEYVDMAQARIAALPPEAPQPLLHHADVHALPELVPAGSVDLAITSPPYWNVLSAARSADRRATRDYAGATGDLARIEEYAEFVQALGGAFAGVLTVLRPGGYCCVVVMDLRKGKQFYPFHSDLASELTRRGFLLDDIIIWDRHADYNSLRPLGYPSVFRVNKVHEFILIFQKPRAQAGRARS
jgi:DNA modification methylase